MNAEKKSTKKNTLAEVYLGMFDGTIAEIWFKWAEWLLVTAALYALGVAGKSQVVVYLAYFSAVLTMLYALDKIGKAIETLGPALKVKPLWVKLVAMPLLFVFAMYLAVALSRAIASAFVLTIAK